MEKRCNMYAIAVPLLPNKVEAWKAWTREGAESRREEFDAFNERMGLTLHRAWLMEGPKGPLVIVVYDGPGAENFLQRVAKSKEPFDKWFRERITEYHGVDFSKLDALSMSKMYVDWRAPTYAEAEQ
jgi:hypothetical protein